MSVKELFSLSSHLQLLSLLVSEYPIPSDQITHTVTLLLSWVFISIYAQYNERD